MKTAYFLGFIIWLITLPMEASGQERLKKLITEREQLHQQWQASESQKSGLFGNRTKKDIETTEIGYEKEDYKFIAQKAEEDIVKLKRALNLKDEKIQSGLKEKRTYEWTTLIFFVSSMVLGFLYYKKRTRQVG
ncbi:Clp protease ClpB [Cyclobacterium marinum]|uniref:Clp protease ClpB n=1 Tax=Cyclobacterium marinum TaxID=104 RepID=UPI0011F01A4A|nr:Clp protease ClpB [Cyclobacterium marinum]MBI0400928.1 Clp protease ClpB [Cyclobacterium marinum]